MTLTLNMPTESLAWYFKKNPRHDPCCFIDFFPIDTAVVRDKTSYANSWNIFHFDLNSDVTGDTKVNGVRFISIIVQYLSNTVCKSIR